MKLLFGLVIAAVLVVAAFAADTDKAWKEFKGKHGKQYKNHEHEAKSRMNFEKNHKFIEEHNARTVLGQEKYTLAHNELSDLDIEEYRTTRCGTKVDQILPLTESRSGAEAKFDFLVDVRQKQTVDYTTDACMTPPKNQGNCGSCYAFSAIAALEFYNCKKTGVKTTFSEQQLVDCSRNYGNGGCNGGDESVCYVYVSKSALGIASDATYPYTATDGGTCTYSTSKKVGSLTSYKRFILSNSESMLISIFTLAKGPVNVQIDAGQPSFEFYKSGVYNDRSCTPYANHAVLLVGYGTENGTKYWKIKNSYGPNWGSNGYMKMERDVNLCGIANGYAYYPVV